MTQFNDMLAPPPIKLPEDLVPTPITESVVLAHPASPLAWATLAEEKIAAATTAPNQGVLRAIAALARASAMIGDQAEYDRCRQMLSDADPDCVAPLLDELRENR